MTGLPDAVRFVTGNSGKVEEMRAALDPLGIAVVPDDRGYPEIQHDTLEGVCEAGVGYLKAVGVEAPFLIEDAGLFVPALEGFPGVYSKYVLETVGIEGLLRLMDGLPDSERFSYFESDLCYVDAAAEVHHFLGRCDGQVTDTPAGDGGFGFDPVFIPEGFNRTFAQMEPAKKNQISHRGRAISAFVEHLGKTAKT